MLLELIRADGHKIVQITRGAEYKILCPFHSEKTPSCSIKVNTRKPFYHCFGCQAHGDAVDYLVNYRKLSKADALEIVKGRRQAAPASRPPPEAADTKPKLVWREELPDRHAGRYLYRRADGMVVFAVQRYHIEGKKTFGWYTRAKREKSGPVLWLKGLHYKSARPLYRLPELIEADPKRVMVVEGEKCAEAVVTHMKAAVTTWAGGSANWTKTDFSPLHGRRLVLVADGDEPGHAAMHGLKDHLTPHCPDIVLILPPATDEKLDIADALEKNPAGIAAWMKQHVVRPPVPAWLGRNRYFSVQEVTASGVRFLTADGDVVWLDRDALARPASLLGLAPLDWWSKTLDSPLSTERASAFVRTYFGP